MGDLLDTIALEYGFGFGLILAAVVLLGLVDVRLELKVELNGLEDEGDVPAVTAE